VGLNIRAGNCIVQGLAINRFCGVDSAAIWLQGNTGHNIIQGNFIGTDVSGTFAAAGPVNISTSATTYPATGTHAGVWITGSPNDLIGTTGSGANDPAQRNIISGCAAGVVLGGANTVVAGNFIGTDRTGTVAIANWGGIAPFGTTGALIGTSGAGQYAADQRNVISGNKYAYASGGGSDTGTTIAGNYIGPAVSGVSPLTGSYNGNSYTGNASGGMGAFGTSCTIGGTNPAMANVIAWNGGVGVWVAFAASGIRIEGNSILDNSLNTGFNSTNYNPGNFALGIDVGGSYSLVDGSHPDGVTLNDSQGHIGPNNFQNFPVLTSVISSSTNTCITGTFSEAAEPNTAVTLDFYANASKDPSGYGQGQTWLGSTTVMTDATGYAPFTADLAVTSVAGQWISATATDPAGNTSEFCADVQAASLIVLNATANWALSLSGSSSINVAGSVLVDSSSKTALTESGSASIKAANIDVVGGVSTSGSATLSPAPTTGVAVVPDPLASLATPSTSGVTNYGAANYGSGAHTLNPGMYTSITASGAASLTLNAGVYIIEGGGLTISGSAVVSGTGVMLYNTNSNYPSSGGSFGSISISGSGTLNLTAPTTGTYAGVVLFQDRSNTQKMTLSGSAFVEGTSNIAYIPDALVSLSNLANLQGALVVGTLSLSGSSDPSSGSPVSRRAGLADPTPLLAAFDPEAAWDGTARPSERLLPGAASQSPAAAWRHTGQGLSARPFIVEGASAGASQRFEPAWLRLAGTNPEAPADALDYLFATLGY
jgi:hypothetical protein